MSAHVSAVRLVDGELLALAPTCGCGAPRDDARYLGAQVTSTPGDWLLLANCRACRTTLVQAGVNDAALCARCGHLVLGDAEDPKIVVCESDVVQVVCADCAPSFRELREGLPVIEIVDNAQTQVDAQRIGIVRRPVRALSAQGGA